MWRRRKDNLKRRMMSGILACLLVATSLTNTVGIITSFAGQTTNIPRVSYKYDDLKNDKGQLDKMVQINVQAENESFAPGSEMVLKVYVQNLSDQNLTGGSLKWSGKGLEEAGFLDEEEEDLFNGPGWDGEDNDSDTSDLMEELGNFSVTGLRKSVALKIDDTAAKDETEAPEQNVEIITDVETEEEEDDTSDPQTDEEGKRIRGIELAPGEVYETRFYGTVEDMDSIVTRKVTFEFLAGTDDNKVAQDKAEFTYNTGMALVLPIEFDDGPALMTNELNTMYIHTRFEDEKILDEYTWDITDEDEATPSDAERHEITVATMSNGTEDSSEGTTPANMKYSIVTYGAKLQGVEAWRDDDKSSWGEVATGVSFRVADGTEPGVYFGRVTTSIRRDGKSYKTTQGFHFFVLGDGQIVLKGNVNGAEIQVKGDRESFPEGDMLSLKVTEVPAEKMDLVQEAMAQKADELGVSVDKMKAVDIKVIADGEEQELRGQVEVTFANLQMDKVDGDLDGDDLADTEVENDAEELEEFEEISNHSVFGLRKANAQQDQAEEESVVDDLAAETESQDENGEKEDSSLAVWHFDEDAGAIDEMDSETNDDGDVVMNTEHFSIYIVVDVNRESIDVTFEHYANVEHFVTELRTMNGVEEQSVVEVKMPKEDSPKTHLKLETVTKPTEIYSSETRTMRNGLKISPEDISKLDLANRKKAQKNYELSEIEIWKESKLEKKWIRQKDVNGNYIQDENDRYIWKTESGSTENITLTGDSTIRFIYEPQTHEKGLVQRVQFYDYDVTDGVITDGSVNTNRQGINALDNYEDKGQKTDKPHLNVGQQNIGLHIFENDLLDGVPINKHPAKVGNHTDYKITQGIVGDELGSDGLPVFNVYEPGLFKKGKGSTPVDGYDLVFEQVGDTYTLTSVYKDEGKTKVLERLDQMTRIANDKIFSNNFWPMDSYEEHIDPLFGSASTRYKYKGDDGKSAQLPTNDDDPETYPSNKGKDIQNTNNQNGHNWLFGMVCEMKFVVGDYVGPLTYYFRGDDDFWLFLDGELVVDIGGIHSTESKTVDLWEKIIEGESARESYKNNKVITEGSYDKNEVHKLKVFYNERGESGSTCYMKFTLPDVVVSPPPFDVEHTSVSVKKVWEDDNNAANMRPSSIEVELLQDGEVYEVNGTPIVATLAEGNDWSYTWNHLPAEKHTYTVSEKTKLLYYTTQGPVAGTGQYAQYDFVITNTYHATTDVRVVKKWKDEIKDNNDNPTMRPKSIEVQLYQNGVPYTDSDGNEVKVTLPTEPNEWKEDEWEYTWSGLPKYDSEGNEYEYTVREIGGDWLKSNRNPNGWYVSEVDGTTITNTYIPEFVSKTVTKRWDDMNDKFGLQPDSISVELYQNGKKMEEKTANLPKKDAAGNLIKDAAGQPVWEYKWYNLPKYDYIRNADGTVTQTPYEYTLKEVISSPYGKYYTTAYSPVDTNEDTVTITNTLKTARFRVAKSIDNFNDQMSKIDAKDLGQDEFIVNVEKQSVSSNDAFNTGIVLKHAGVEDNEIKDSSEVSGYIEVPVTDEGVLYKVTEIVPKEYTSSKTDFLTTIALTKAGVIIKDSEVKDKFVKEESIGESAGVRIFPDADVIVVVHNDFGHVNFFHHDVSVSNLFKGGSDILRPTGTEKNARNLVVAMNAFIPEEMGKDRERKYSDEERFM